MRPINGFLFVSLGTRFKEKNKNGIYMPVLENALVDMATGQTTYNPEEHKNIEGTVVYASDHLSNYTVRQKYRSKVGGRYSTPPEMIMSREMGYACDVSIGYTIYFHYLENDWNDGSRWFFDQERGEYLLIIHYRWIMAYKDSDGVLHAVNGKVLVEQVEEENVTFENGIGYRKAASGILTELPGKKKKDIGRIVAHSKWELEYEGCSLKNGDLVFISKFGKFNNPIDDRDMWVMNQDDVMARAEYNEVASQYDYFPVGNHLLLTPDKDELKRMLGSIYIPKNQEAKDVLVSNQIAMASMQVVKTGREWGYNAEATHARLHEPVAINDIPMKARVNKIGSGCSLGYQWNQKVQLVKAAKEFMAYLEDDGVILIKEEDVAIPLESIKNFSS
jgi:co-chaperonin GroES (HSP10)